MRQRRVTFGLLSVLFFFLLFSGCRLFQDAGTSASSGPPKQLLEPGSLPPESVAGSTGEGLPSSENRRVIRSASLLLEVRRVEAVAEEAKGIVVKIGGFIADSQIAEDDAGRKSIALVLRVPSERLDEAFKALKGLGHIRNERMQSEDVTEQVVDLEARLANARRLEARLLELLSGQARTLKDVLDAERELARIRESIETMEGRRRAFGNSVSLATIALTLVAPPGFGRGIFAPLAGSMQHALSAFSSSLAWLAVAIFAAVPWIALFLVLSWLFLKFLRWWIHKKREAKAKKMHPEQ